MIISSRGPSTVDQVYRHFIGGNLFLSPDEYQRENAWDLDQKQLELQIRMVVGFAEITERKESLVALACNHPNLLVIPFSAELIRGSV
jgi:hypothetical protein